MAPVASVRDRPLRIDCLARELPGRAALVASGHDGAEAAVQICKDLADVLSSGEYRLRLETAPESRDYIEPPEQTAPTANTTRQRFSGLPMTSKVAGRCAVCAQPIHVGASIVYNYELRRAAHRECGDSIVGGRR
jgi:hypothetical protein